MKSFIPVFATSLCATWACASDPAGLARTIADAPDAAPTLAPAPSDAGAPEDASPATGAPPAELALPRCGPPPYQPLVVRARDIQAATGREQPGVTVTLKHCPGQTFVTGPEGRITILVTVGAETWVGFQAPGYLPWMIGEFAVGPAVPTAGLVATLVPKSLASTVVPGYQADSPMLFVQVQAGRTSANEPCRARDGVVLGVEGHPNVTVMYRASGSNGSYQKAVGTSAEGVAIVTGLPADTGSVDLLATKMGCSYMLSYGDANSPALLPILRTPLAPGVITHQSVNPVR